MLIEEVLAIRAGDKQLIALWGSGALKEKRIALSAPPHKVVEFILEYAEHNATFEVS